MRTFAELSAGGRTRRLSDLARRHLRQRHGLNPIHLRPLRATFNRFFDATATDGRRFAVRVSASHRIHAPGVEDVEHRWLLRLTDLGAPQLVLDDHGASCHTYHQPEFDGPRTVTVFTWVSGRRVRRPLGVASAFAAGRLLAELHERANSADLNCAGLGLDATAPVTFRPTDAINRWSDGPTDLLHQALARAQATIDGLWADPPHRPHLLHGDFGPHNLLTADRGPIPIDFQDLQWGFAVQDVAVTLTDMARWRSSSAAQRAVADGYRSVRPWPAHDPEVTAALAAARTLNLVNLGLVVRRPGFEDRVGRHLDDLRRWMND